MTFYAIHEGFYEGVQIRIDQLKYACESRGIAFKCIDSLKQDFAQIPQLNAGDLFYNFARGSQTLESLLLNNRVTTFYVNNPTLNTIYSTTDWGILHDKASIKSPKTIYSVTTDRNLLQKYITYLNGFPIILKVAGGTRGVGTIKIENWHGLFSTVDYLASTSDKFIMREFINAKSGCRMIVLGDEVIAAADFEMQVNDFRNAVDASQIKYHKREYPDEVKKTAIKATHIANTEFGGVDFLEDHNGDYYLLEVNFPTGFSGLTDLCGVDIPGKMVEYLMNKSNHYESKK